MATETQNTASAIPALLDAAMKTLAGTVEKSSEIMADLEDISPSQAQVLAQLAANNIAVARTYALIAIAQALHDQRRDTGKKPVA